MANPGLETNGKCSIVLSSDGDSSGGHISQDVIEMLRGAITRENRCPDVLPESRRPETGSRGPLPASIGVSDNDSNVERLGSTMGKAARDALEQKPCMDVPICFPSNLVESLTSLREKSSISPDEDTSAAPAAVDPATEVDPATGDGGDQEESSDAAARSLGSAAARAISDALRRLDIGQFSAAKALGRAATEAAIKEIGKPATNAGHSSGAATTPDSVQP